MEAAGVERHLRRRTEQRLDLGERRVRRVERAGVVELGAGEHVRAALVGRGEEALEAAVELGGQLAHAARLRQAVELVERPVLLLPQLAGALGLLGAHPPHRGLQLVGARGLVELAGRAQPGEQVVGAAGAGGAAQEGEQPAAKAGVRERHRAVDRERDAVGVEHLLHHRRVARGVAEHHRHLARRGAVAEQREHVRAHQLDLGALAARRVGAHRLARRAPLAGVVVEQAPLEVVERVARLVGVVVGHRLERRPLAGDRRQLLVHRGHRLERGPAGLERQRHGHVGLGAAAERLERVELERREVVEAVDEHRGAAPARGLAPQRVERAAREQLAVHQARGVEPVAVARVQGRELVGVAAPRPVGGPRPERPLEPLRLDGRPAQLLGEPHGSAGEPRPLGGRPQHAQPRVAHRLLHEQLALHLRRHRGRVAGSLGDPPVEVLEADHLDPEDRAALGQLALVVLHVAERGHHQDRLLPHPRPQRAQHLARLGGVGGTGDERERHPS